MIRTLNSLRFILILMIMISHSTLPITQGMHDYLGEFPVAIFFVISGFVLSLSYGERLEKGEVSNKHFFLSRIFKLYPLYLVIIAITIAMDGRLGYLGPWYQTLAHALLLQCWIPTHHFVSYLNASTWFISDILFFYLIFKHLYKWMMNKTWASILSISAIYMLGYVAISLLAKGDYSASFIYFYPPFRLIDFSLGIMLYKFYGTQRSKNILTLITTQLTTLQKSIADAIIILLSVGLCYLSYITIPNIRCAALYWIPSLTVVYYIIVSDNSKGWLARLLHHKLLLWLASISMEIYLCHGLALRLVQSIFLKIWGEDIPYLYFQFALSLIIVICMAWISKKIIVCPVYNKLKIYR